MKVLVTGVKGQLGHDVIEELEKRDHTYVGVDIEEMDITDYETTREVIGNAGVQAVIHCAAYTAVDAAEENVEICRKVNVLGTENIAKVCGELGLKMVYLSTDYVFHGQGEAPWKPEDPKAPLNVYGQSKYDGELAVQKYTDQYFIVRTAWVFGLNGNNFINTMLKLGESRPEVNVVDDQAGSPTYTKDLAVLLVDMVETEQYGVYHATNEGYVTWYGFAIEIFAQAGLDVKVNPVDSSGFLQKAKRPTNSRLNKDKLEENGFQRLPVWQDALHRYLQETGRI